MDTKQKNTGASRKAPPKRSPRPESGRTDAQQPRSSQAQEYKRTPPQGASVYGAPTGARRTTASSARTVGKTPKKQSALQKLFQKSSTSSQGSKSSRDRVIRAQKQM